MKAAYADPPYPGQSHRYYHGAEVDHAALVARLERDYDGWALSTNEKGLRIVLPLCPPAVRVAVWMMPNWTLKQNLPFQNAWEPVLVKPLRKWARGDGVVIDHLVECKPMPQDRVITGQKPEAFSRWVFSMLKLKPEDELTDLFPGSGAVARAHERWRKQSQLVLR